MHRKAGEAYKMTTHHVPLSQSVGENKTMEGVSVKGGHDEGEKSRCNNGVLQSRKTAIFSCCHREKERKRREERE